MHFGLTVGPHQVQNFLLYFVFTPNIQVFTHHIVHIALTTFDVLPRLSYHFPIRFTVDLFHIGGATVSIPDSVDLV